MERGCRYGIEIHIPRLLNSMESDLKAAMDKRHRSVIVSPGDIELIDLVSQDILGNDCYGLASDIIITSDQNRPSQLPVEGSKETLNRLMTFQKALRQQDIKMGYTKKLSRT
jgi:hypothetical protein